MNRHKKYTGTIPSFDRMFATKSFVHHYVGEGNEEGQFGEARNNVRALINDYAQIEANYDQYNVEEEYDDSNKKYNNKKRNNAISN